MDVRHAARTRFVSNSRQRQHWKLLAACAALALLLVACGDGTGQDDPAAGDAPPDASTDSYEQLVEAAQAEGQVIVYAAYPEEVTARLAEGFTDAYGIDVVHQRSPTAENYARVEREVSAGQLRQDVMTLIDDPAWYAEYDGHLAELREDEMPNLAALPEAYRTNKSLHVYQSYYGFVYNTDELTESDVPDDFRGILDDDRFQDRIATTHPAVSNAFVVWHALQIDQWGQEEHEAFWERFLVERQGRLSDTVASLVNQVAAGELLLMGPTHWGQAGPLHAEGAPIGIVYRDPVMSLGSGIVAFHEGPNPNAAKLFINWLLGHEAQEIFCGNSQCASHLDIEGAVPTPQGVDLISPDMAMGETLGPEYVVPLFDRLGTVD